MAFSAVLPPLFHGRSIREVANTNLSLLDSVALNQVMDATAAMPEAADRNSAWAELDATVMDLAPMVPLLSAKALYLAGSEVGNMFVHVRYGTPDPAALSVVGSEAVVDSAVSAPPN